MIELENGNISYDGKSIVTIKHFVAEAGVLVGVIGASGSGKTSLLNVLACQNPNFDGFYKYDGKNIETIDKYNENIAYIKQEPIFLENLTCYDNIEIALKITKAKLSVLEILSIIDLDIDKNKYPNELSGGEKRKLSLALALAKDCDVWLCDELTASLDDENKNKMVEVLYKLAHTYGKYVILSSHDKITYAHCDVIYAINNGILEKITKETMNFNSNKGTKFTAKDKHITFLENTFIYWHSRRKSVLNKIIILMLMTISISLSTLAIYGGNQYQKHLKQLYDIMGTNQSYVFDDSLGIGNYNINNKDFKDNSTYDYLKQLEDVENAYSFRAAFVDRYVVDINTFINGDTSVLIEKNKNGLDQLSRKDEKFNTIDVELGNQVTTIKRPKVDDEQSNMLSYIFPYYDEQHLETKCMEISNSNDTGVYISADFARLLNITSLESDIYLSYYVAIPIAKIKYNITGYLEDGSTRILNEEYPASKIIKIRVPVKGILRGEFMQLSSQCEMYIQANELNKIYNEARQSVYYIEKTKINLSDEKTVSETLLSVGFNQVFSESNLMSFEYNRTKYAATKQLDFTDIDLDVALQPIGDNCYTIFTRETSTIKELQNKIRQFDSKLLLKNSTFNAIQMGNVLEKNNEYINIFSYGVVATIFVLVFVFSFLNEKMRKNEYPVLVEMGYNSKKIINYILVNIFYEWVMITFASIILTAVLFFIGLKMEFFFMGLGFTELLLSNTIYLIVLSLLLTLCMNSVSLLKGLLSHYFHRNTKMR